MSAAALDVPVRVTRHSLERFSQRIGRTAFERDLVTDVRDALDAGRVACRKPAWMNQRRVKNHTGRGKIRFAWNETRDVVYVLKFGAQATVVLTVEVPQ